MKHLLIPALVLAGFLSSQAVLAQSANGAASMEENNPPAATAQPQSVAPAPIIISWDRVGGKEKWWV